MNLIRMLAAGVVACSLVAPIASASDDVSFASTPAKVERGKYLVTIAGCNDCHTPLKAGPAGPEPDWSRMLSGHPSGFAVSAPAAAQPSPWTVSATPTSTAWSGEWGVSFTANLTPDPETGLGKWTFRNFKDTIRTGRHMGRGRAILPPMPIQMYKHMTDEDLEAVFAYLRSIPAISNKVPEPLPPALSASSDATPAAAH
jgi:mono/diheme cytochrome c family protein